MRLFLSLILLLNFLSCSEKSSSEREAANDNTTTGDPGGSTPPANDFKMTCEEARFVRLLNLYRQSQGFVAVVPSKNAVLSSRWHARDMIEKNYFAHTEPNGRTFSARASAFGYTAWAENIAAGNTTGSGTFCQWKNSAGHNTNMLSSNHRSTGIGIGVGGPYGAYWSSNFGPVASDALTEPYTNDAGCTLPVVLPSGC